MEGILQTAPPPCLRSVKVVEEIIHSPQGSCTEEEVRNLDVCDESARPNVRMCHSEYSIPLQVDDKGFTALFMVNKRWFLLYKLLPHYTQMRSLFRVVILWYNPGMEPPKNLTDAKYTNGVETLIHVLTVGHIDLRFQSFPEIQTQGKTVLFITSLSPTAGKDRDFIFKPIISLQHIPKVIFNILQLIFDTPKNGIIMIGVSINLQYSRLGHTYYFPAHDITD